MQARHGPHGVVVRGRHVVVQPDAPAAQEPQDQRAGNRQDALHEQVAGAAGQVLAVVPGTGETGQAVVERDVQPDRDHRVADHPAAVVGVVQPHVDHDRDHPHGDRGHRGGHEPGVDLRERLGQRLVGRHRQRGPGGGQDRGLGGRGRRGQHHQQQQVVEGRADAGRAENGAALDRQDVARVIDVAQAVARGLDAREGLHGEDHQGVGDEQDEGGEDRGQAGRPGLVLGLLVDRDGGVPAPVDEDHQDDAAGERAEAGDLERVEPGEARGAGVRAARVRCRP